MNAVGRLGKAITRLERDRKALRGKAEAGAPMSWAELRVHRTIDAQLAILRMTVSEWPALSSAERATLTALADAILGGDS